ncbi:hypothetical protein Nepgr_022238 [Nepenthes gracilis]|uniref:Uncharacterized protein n=1 Tax=Nepenthes gracilis TaxID=150966 RepID=A0AAD3XWL9_NEPGR|nr:hypothetical protein Nepgr_022238 [Nepenthes gracilis]
MPTPPEIFPASSSSPILSGCPLSVAFLSLSFFDEISLTLLIGVFIPSPSKIVLRILGFACQLPQHFNTNGKDDCCLINVIYRRLYHLELLAFVFLLAD